MKHYSTDELLHRLERSKGFIRKQEGVIGEEEMAFILRHSETELDEPKQQREGNKMVEVKMEFKGLSKKQMEHLLKAEKELLEAGVSFDTGYGCKKRTWELDWSLKGARVVLSG